MDERLLIGMQGGGVNTDITSGRNWAVWRTLQRCRKEQQPAFPHEIAQLASSPPAHLSYDLDRVDLTLSVDASGLPCVAP